MTEQLALRKERTNNCRISYSPIFFRLSNSEEREKLDELLSSNAHIAVFDELHSQLIELIRLRNPRVKYDDSTLEGEIEKLTKGNPENYGVWVYYPWSYRLLHILDEKEFIEVRTNRNRNKITLKDRDVLSTKKLGVVGLSVGKTIALTMTMERSYGEIRIADFDTLELSNLNRLQTGLNSLGLQKTVIAAREIMELDPFMKVSCFSDGLTENNIDDFFTANGNLDLIVDECDSLDIKILLRQKAKELRIPVLMDMNDRGTLDVERFDLEPDRPLLHGLIDHLDLNKIKDLTNFEKIPYILPMLGQKTISPGLKASILEMGNTLSTWPQLSSSVALGGAVAADLCRRIWLDKFHDSGRYWVDIEEQICDSSNQIDNGNSELLGKLSIYVDNNLVSEKDLWEKMITSAPAIGNFRNWDVIISPKELVINFIGSGNNTDFSFRLIDLLNAGHLIDHIRLLTGIESEFKIMPESITLDISKLNLEVEVMQQLPGYGYKYASKDQNSNDIIGKVNKLLAESGIQATAEPVEPVDSKLKLLTKAEKTRHLHPFWSIAHLNNFINWGEGQQGVPVDELNFSDSDKALLDLSNDPNVIELLNEWNGGEIFSSLYERRFRASKGFVFIAENPTNEINIVILGTKLNRLLIQLNNLDIALEPIPALPLILVNKSTINGSFLTDSNAITVNENEVPTFIGRII